MMKYVKNTGIPQGGQSALMVISYRSEMLGNGKINTIITLKKCLFWMRRENTKGSNVRCDATSNPE